VDHARGVRGAQALEHVVDDRPDLAEGQVLLALEPIGQRLAGELLEHQQVRAVRGLAHLDELADVGALDGRGDLRLALEALHQIRLHRRAGEEHLDRHVPRAERASLVERVGPVAGGGPDLAHPPATEQSSDSVARQYVTRVDRHVAWIGTVP
jgi:hypothetical protein